MMTFAQTIEGVYVRGNSFRLRPDNKAFKVRGEEMPPPLAEAVRAHKDKILVMLTGDPLSGPGWEGRTVLWKSALRWLDMKLADMGLDGTRAEDRVARVLESQVKMEALNTAWMDGTFEEFRDALRAYVGSGLEVARKQVQGYEQESLEFSA